MSYNNLPSIQKLNGRDNYKTWQFGMKTFLELEGLWSCVDGSDTTNPIEERRRRDLKARANIILMLEPCNYVYVQSAKTSKDVWESLRIKYEDITVKKKGALKRSYVSHEQKQLMLEFCESYPKLLTGKFTPDFTVTDAQQIWKNIAVALNAASGGEKSWRQWRKTWHDMRSPRKVEMKAKARNLTTSNGNETEAVADESSTNFAWKSRKIDEIEAMSGNRIASNRDVIIEDESLNNFEFVVYDDEIIKGESGTRTSPDPICSDNDVPSQIHLEENTDPPQLTKRSNSKESEPQQSFEPKRFKRALTPTSSDVESHSLSYYYRRKLELMEREVVAKEQIANALLTLVSTTSFATEKMATTCEDVEFLD